MNPEIDLVDQAAAFLREHGLQDVYTRRLDDLTGQEGIVLRRMPSRVVATYMDGVQTIDEIYQVICKYRSEQHAMDVCYEVAGMLNGADIESANGSYRFTSQDIDTSAGGVLPHEVRLHDSGLFAWETRIRARIERG